MENDRLATNTTHTRDFVIGKNLKPEILSHPNIPKPLHGVNPRLLMGPYKWDKLRKEVYASSDYHCVGCGVEKTEAKRIQRLEVHEYYHIDYEKGRVEIQSLQPLCNFCHSFIHSGHLVMSVGKYRTRGDVKEILEHGFKILAANKLKVFPSTFLLAKKYGAKTYGVKPYQIDFPEPEWGKWRLVWEGKEYSPKFTTYEDWLKHYSSI